MLQSEQLERWCADYAAYPRAVSARMPKPSVAALKAVQYAAEQGVREGHALDLGCGAGRNSFYLLQQGYSVTAIDYAPDALMQMRDKMQRLGSQITPEQRSRLQIHRHDLSKLNWPVARPADMAMDLFSFKSIIETPAVMGYARGLARSVRKGGVVMLATSHRDDPFYAAIGRKSRVYGDSVVTNPFNGLAVRLWEPDALLNVFRPHFKLVDLHIREVRHNDHGLKGILRKNIMLYLQRTPAAA